jgi:hypothetical protein
MTSQAHDLVAEVLDLPAEERARLLELLLASFEPKSDSQKAWIWPNSAVQTCKLEKCPC